LLYTSRRTVVIGFMPASMFCRFVENVGAVAHHPVATLDFPLTNAPRNYPRRHSFAAQVDEEMLDRELQELRNQDNAAAAGLAQDSPFAAGTPDADAAQHSGVDTNSSSAAALVDIKALEEGALEPHSPAAASKDCNQSSAASRRINAATAADTGTAGTANGSTRKTAAVQLPLRRSPSGTMQLNPLDPAVAVQPRMTASELLLRTLPIWMTVLVLLLTRIPAIPIKKILQR
jgi:hypothetical protein